jgi:hypothetical protein
MTTATETIEEAYKAACDDVLLKRGKSNKRPTVIKPGDGCILERLKQLQATKKNG